MKTPEEIKLEKENLSLKAQITRLHGAIETLEKEIDNLKAQNVILDTKAKNFQKMYFDVHTR